jgi:ParB/RepB/Spo0J family partition protein
LESRRLMTDALPAKAPEVPIHLVWLDREKRQRRKIETKDLEASISQIGLIQPIVIHSSFELIAGERRLTACKNLGWDSIPAIFLGDLPAKERKLVELEENIKRNELDWKDYALALDELHDIHQAEDPAWTQNQTAKAASILPSLVTMTLAVAEALKAGDEKVLLCGGLGEAHNVLKRRQGRVLDEELNSFAEFARGLAGGETRGVQTEGPLAAAEAQHRFAEKQEAKAQPKSKPLAAWSREASEGAILAADFLAWAPSYAGQKFNLIHCDFPYGIGAFGGKDQFSGATKGEGAYRDEKEVFFGLLDCLTQNLDRIMSVSAHLVFWTSFRHLPKVICQLETAGLLLAPNPLVWHKSDWSAVGGDFAHWPRHSYELALLASRADRPLVVAGFDSYAGLTDHSLHPSTKPEPMLRHFFKMLCDQNTRMLDPTCGSGASLRAAESLGASFVLGLEKDSEYRARAIQALHTSRLAREGNRESSK